MNQHPTKLTVYERSVDYVVQPDDAGCEVQFNTADTALSATLPTPVDVGNGFTVILRNMGANLLSVAASGGAKIDGELQISLDANESVWLRSDGFAWKTVAGKSGVAPADSTPAGSVIWFAASTAPGGYLICDGSQVSRSTYANLFSVVGEVFGSGDGSTTFNLPDLRAEFVRGWDAGRDVDPGRAFGSSQSDELRSHTHDYVGTDFSSGAGGTAKAGNSILSTSLPTGGDETRPRNVALLPCIKA